jgi:hypothetical protein
MIRLQWILLSAMCLTLLAGCGGSGDVVVTGQLHHENQLYKPAQGEQVMITFAEEKDGTLTGKSFPTRLDPDGTFNILGPDNAGISPGKYRVGITSVPEVPVPGQIAMDKFQGRYEISKSPLKQEVTAASSYIKLEIQ